MRRTLKLSVLVVVLAISTTTFGNELENKISSKNLYTILGLEIYPDVDTDPKSEKKTDKSEPVFSEFNETVYVSFENTKNTPIYMEVRDGMNRLLYSETVDESKAVLKSFNFRNAFEGHYTIKINNGSATFIKEIEIL